MLRRALRRRRNGWKAPESSYGLDPQALAAIGIDLEEVRRRVEESFGRGALERTISARRRR